MKNKNIEELIIALSLANLMSIGIWRDVIFRSTFDYHIRIGTTSTDYLGAILTVLITAALLYAGVRLWRFFYHGKFPLIKWCFLIVVCLTLNIIRIQFSGFGTSSVFKLAFLALLAAVVIVAMRKWQTYVFQAARTFVLFLSPFVLVTFSQALVGIMYGPSNRNSETIAKQLAAIQPKQKDKVEARVIWIIFDEFDYRIPFEVKAVKLPEFDRLKKVSIFASAARPPAANTLESIPSLLIGKTVISTRYLGADELLLEMEDKRTLRFSEKENAFSDVKSLDGNVAVIGNYHPYCLLFGKTLSACKWEGWKFSDGKDLKLVLFADFRKMLAQMTFMYRFVNLERAIGGFMVDKLTTEELANAHFLRRKRTLEVLTDPKIDLAFIHWPIPHPPSRFDKETGKFVDNVQDYVDNLVLADKDFGIFRKSLEEANMWDNSVIIVSSDHPWRVNDALKENTINANDLKVSGGIQGENIPFFLKLKNQKEEVIYEKPLNTVITRTLISAVMKGEVSTTEGVVDLLDKHRKQAVEVK